MRTVWKYPLKQPGRINLDVPHGAKFIHFDMLDKLPTVWALIDSEHIGLEQRSLWGMGTGHQLPEGTYSHIGSCIDINTGDVWHLFEEK